MGQVKTLIHIHTDYSYDSSLSLDALKRYAQRENFGCIAVTDHDTIDGALRLRSQSDLKIIVGEEVTTRDGDVIGLFLQQCIKPGMSAKETALAIREQGGIVLLPHPFVKVFGCGVREVAWDILDLVDAVEINNAQNIVSLPDRKANRFAEKTGLTRFVGSDSHMPISIAPCYQFMRDFDGPADFLDALRSADLKRGYHCPTYFAQIAHRLVRTLTRLPQSELIGANASVGYSRVPTLPGLSLSHT